MIDQFFVWVKSKKDLRDRPENPPQAQNAMADNMENNAVFMNVSFSYLLGGRNATQSKTNTTGTHTKTARGVVIRRRPNPLAGVPSEVLEAINLITDRSA